MTLVVWDKILYVELLLNISSMNGVSDEMNKRENLTLKLDLIH